MSIISRVVAVDKDSGFEQVMHYDTDTDDITLENKQDVTDIIEFNKALDRSGAGGFKGDMVKVASLPLSIYYDLKQKGILDDQVAFKKWLNDRDNLVFRTRSGRI
jgi:hypothetical protein